MARRGRRAAREEEMRALLRRWERSGMALSRFAEREGIARKTLYRWRQRMGVGAIDLRRAPRSMSAGRPWRSKSPVASFLEVRSPPPRVWSSMAAMFEVVLSSGTTVRVAEHFDAESLRTLLETVRAC